MVEHLHISNHRYFALYLDCLDWLCPESFSLPENLEKSCPTCSHISMSIRCLYVKLGSYKGCGIWGNDRPSQTFKNVNSPYKLESNFRYCGNLNQVLASICVNVEQYGPAAFVLNDRYFWKQVIVKMQLWIASFIYQRFHAKQIFS